MTPEDFPPFEGKLRLVCRACGKTGQYAVGRIFIDPEQFRAADRLEPHYEDMVSFSGYFHCRHCGAGGPWEFPRRTVTQLQLLMILAAADPRRAPVHFVRP